MNQKCIFLSLSLFLILGCGVAKATNGSGVSIDSAGNILFSDKNTNSSTQNRNNTFNPAKGVYVASNQSNTITFSQGVQTTSIEGGIKAEDKKKIALDFEGASKGQSQILNFGSNARDDTSKIQAMNGGEIVFNFSGKNTSIDRKNNYMIGGVSANSQILNNGHMTFNLEKHTTLMLGVNNASDTLVIENQNGNLDFNFSDDVMLNDSSKLNIVNSGSGKTTFKFNNFSNMANLAEFVTDRVELKNTSTGSIEFVFENASANFSTFFGNSKTTASKTDFTFNLKGNSFVLLENKAILPMEWIFPQILKILPFLFRHQITNSPFLLMPKLIE